MFSLDGWMAPIRSVLNVLRAFPIKYLRSADRGAEGTALGPGALAHRGLQVGIIYIPAPN